MTSNRRFAIHVDVTGFKNNIDHHNIVKVQAVTFGPDNQQEEYVQEFLPKASIARKQSEIHGLTKKGLKKSHAPLFNAELGAKFVEFTQNGSGYSDAPWKIHILNNELRAMGLPPLPKLTYTYQLYKELQPQRSKDHKQGQHSLEMIASMYPVGDLEGAYKIAAVQLKMETEKCARQENAAKFVQSLAQPTETLEDKSQGEEKTVSPLIRMNLFRNNATAQIADIPEVEANENTLSIKM